MKSYLNLALIFLKIGSTSFGGFMSLIAIIQKEVNEKRNWVDDDQILDGMFLGSIMPGPMAVNVSVYVGYLTKGLLGGLIALFCVVAPSFILITFLSYLYFSFESTEILNQVFQMVLPAVVGIIVAVAYRMGKRNIKGPPQVLIALISFGLLVFSPGFLTTLFVLFGSSVLGSFLFRKNKMPTKEFRTVEGRNFQSVLFTILTGLLVLVLVTIMFLDEELVELMKVFASVSLGLFGGGYVFIPLMQDMLVNQKEWLSVTEFSDGIALGQVTPGPILISAAFVGYKLQGIAGAAIATVSIFLPSGMLMIIGSQQMSRLKNSRKIGAAFQGLRPAVVGLIFAAAVSLGQGLQLEFLVITVLLISIAMNIFFNVDVLFIVFGAAIVGLLKIIF